MTGSAKITISGKVGDKQEKYDFPASFVEKSGDQSFAFVEKLWAMRRIGEIIDEIDLKGKNDELVKELVNQHTRSLALYKCDQCGFRARQYYWHCPACAAWETYSPRRTEEARLPA